MTVVMSQGIITPQTIGVATFSCFVIVLLAVDFELYCYSDLFITIENTNQAKLALEFFRKKNPF